MSPGLPGDPAVTVRTSGQRRWLGLAGASAGCAFLLLLLSLASRSDTRPDEFRAPLSPAASTPASFAQTLDRPGHTPLAQAPSLRASNAPEEFPQSLALGVHLADAVAWQGDWRLSARRDGTGPAPEIERWIAAGEDHTQLELAPGAWIVSASGSGWRTLECDVDLAYDAGVARDVTLQVRAVARVRGRFIAASAGDLDLLPVRLRALESGEIVSGTCAADGSFVLDGVLAGAHELIAGPGDPPFLTPRALDVVAPELELGSLELPELAAIRVRVVDELGVPVAGARLCCAGFPRGEQALETGADGSALVRFLPRDTQRVFASHPSLGVGNSVLVLDAEIVDAQVQLQRTP